MGYTSYSAFSFAGGGGGGGNHFTSIYLDGTISGSLQLTVPSVVTSYSLVFPAAQGGAGTILINDGSGNLSWGSTSGITIGAINGQAKSANGGVISGGSLYFQTADTSFPGLISTGAQSIAGAKTFTAAISAANLSGTNTGDVTIGTANGLSLVGQALSLGLSSSSTTGALSSADWSTFNSKQAAGNYITALTGDATASGPGSAALTLATVNINVGSFGSASSVGSFTVNAKGLITAASSASIQIAESQVTNLVSDLASKVATASLGNLTDVGTDGIVITGGTGAVVGSVSIAQQVADATHNGYLSSSDWSTFNSKQAAGNYITALTGDVSASGPGSAAATLATVNANVGSFGSASAVGSFTVNGKGLITAASSSSIQIAESQVTNLVSDLASKVATASLGNLTDLGTDGITITGGTGAVVGSVSISQHVADATHNGYLSSADWSTFSATSGAAITALTGDATASGPGSAALTLATVNANVGSFGSASSSPSFTVNAKGLITAASSTSIQIAESQVTNLVSDLASKVATSSLGNLTDAGTDGITITGGTGAVVGSVSIAQHVADSTHNGYLSSSDWSTFNSKGTGSVTSVALADGSTSPIYSISGSPVTTSGTLTFSLATQAANLVFAGPATGVPAQPSFRSIVAADLPVGNLTDVGTDGITITGGTGAVIGSGTSISQHVADATHNGYLSSSDWSTFNGKQAAGNYITDLTGDISASGPGSAAATIQSNVVSNSKLAQMAAHTYKGNNTGSTANAADITSTQLTADLNLFTSTLQGLVPGSGGGTTNFLRADGTWAAPTSSGTVTSVDMSVPSFLSVSGNPITTSGTLAVSYSGTALPVANGGTGATSLTAHDVLIGNGTSAITQVAPSATSGVALISNGSSADPSFGAINLASSSAVSGTLGVANGGTGQSSNWTADGVIYASSTSVLASTSAGTSGQVLTSNGPGVAPTFQTNSPVGFTQSYELINLGLAASVSGNALTVALKQADGSTDPSSGSGSVKIGFRSSTSANGNYNERSATAATSIVVPSGATLATSNGVQSYLWIYALDNAGTVELGISRIKYDEGSIQSTTTISSSATANNVIYSTTGRSNVPVRIIGRISVTESTAGTWATAPSEISLASALDANEVVAARYVATTNSSPGIAAPINFDTKTFDTHNAVSTGTWKFTAPTAGIYSVMVSLNTNIINSVRLFKNGSQDVYFLAITVANQIGTGSLFIQLAAGDYIDVRSDANITLNVNGNNPTTCVISISRLGQ